MALLAFIKFNFENIFSVPVVVSGIFSITREAIFMLIFKIARSDGVFLIIKGREISDVRDR